MDLKKKFKIKKINIIDIVSDIKVCTFVSNKNSWNPLSPSSLPLFGYFVIVNFLLKTKLKDKQKLRRGCRERAELCDNQVSSLNCDAFKSFYFFRPFVLNIFSPVRFFFTFLFSDCFFFVSLLFPDAGGHVSVFVRDGCIFFCI